MRVRLGGTCAAGSIGGGITVPIGDPGDGDDEPDPGSADTHAGTEPPAANPAPAPGQEPAGDPVSAGWPDPVPAANPDMPVADAAEVAAPAPGAATDPATRSGPAEPVEPAELDTVAEPEDPVEPVEEGAGPVDGRKGPSRRRVVDELPDWALSPAQRAKREKAREAARAAAQPRVPVLVEHGPVEWHEAWREIEPTDLMVILARVDLARLDAAAVLDYVAASEKVTAYWQAQRIQGLGEYAARRTEPGSPEMGPDGYARDAVREVAWHLHQSRQTVAAQLAEANHLCRYFP
ncbi:hypothetical protein D477_017511, partial [Arthrobacter crystallopoietes BAB-32]